MNQVEVNRREKCTVDARTAAHLCFFQLITVEQDALEVLDLVRSLRDTFAPIHRIPPEVLSLIPDYYDSDEGDSDQYSVTLTHVCRSWRDVFISRSSLWTRLNFFDVDKTRTYIQRSQTFPLDMRLKEGKEGIGHLIDAFSLAIPHIRRAKFLAIDAEAFSESNILRHFRCNMPLLERLDIENADAEAFIDTTVFSGDLSSLRELRLYCVATCLPPKNLTNLRDVSLMYCRPGFDVTQLLDFFESAPLLRAVKLRGLAQGPSGAPPDRTVSLPHLNTLDIDVNMQHTILLNHLCIPAGTSLTLILFFRFGNGAFLLLDCLPERSSNLRNLTHITTINLLFESAQKFVRLSGPSGSLYILARRTDRRSFSNARQILSSLNPLTLSTIRRLSVSKYDHRGPAGVETCPVFQTLSSTNRLQTLVLIDCDILPFIFALDPGEHPSNLVLCPNMENLILYIVSPDEFHVKQLIGIAEHRASRGVGLRSITIVGLDEFVPEMEVLKLREYVTHVDCRVNDAEPAWDDVGGVDSESEWV